MALKQDVLQIAAEMHDEADRLTVFASRLESIAETVEPEAEPARSITPLSRGTNGTAVRHGRKVGRRDLNGKPLRAGDVVQVYASERYGDPSGIVIGEGPDAGDDKERVAIKLDGGLNDCYTPSTGRVERIARAHKEHAPAEDAEKHAPENGSDTSDHRPIASSVWGPRRRFDIPGMPPVLVVEFERHPVG